MTERRKFKRFSAYMDILYNELGSTFPKTNYYLKNISREGVGLYGEPFLSEGSVLTLKINVPGDDKSIDAVGEVVWSRKKNDYCNEAGVSFKMIKNDDRFRLLNYAYNTWLRTKKEVGQVV